MSEPPPPTPSGVTIPKPVLVGSAVGLGVILLGAGGAFAAIAISNVAAEAEAAAEARAAEEAAQERRESLFSDAVEACDTDEFIVQTEAAVRDAGESLYVNGRGGSDLVIFMESEHANCILGELDAPSSIYDRMGQTRALDGTLEGQWDDLIARWSYHPDSGLDIIIEFTD